MDFIVYLDLPAGFHIGITVEWIRQFFIKREDPNRALLRLCINLQTPIPSRMVQKEETAFKDAIIDQLLDPSMWNDTQIILVFRGTNCGIRLDKNRKPVD